MFKKINKWSIKLKFDIIKIGFRNTYWFTNINYEQWFKNKKYYIDEGDKNNPDYTNPEFSRYDNYDAINVDKTANIPCDYDGIMGIPITFLDKYNTEHFKIVGNKYRKKVEVILMER